MLFLCSNRGYSFGNGPTIELKHYESTLLRLGFCVRQVQKAEYLPYVIQLLLRGRPALFRSKTGDGLSTVMQFFCALMQHVIQEGAAFVFVSACC